MHRWSAMSLRGPGRFGMSPEYPEYPLSGLSRVRREVDSAARALGRGDEAAARALLDEADGQVKRFIATVIKQTNVPKKVTPYNPICTDLLFEQQLELLRSLHTARRHLHACKSRRE